MEWRAGVIPERDGGRGEVKEVFSTRGRNIQQACVNVLHWNGGR